MTTRRRYQKGSLIDDKDRWAIRWWEDVLDPNTGKVTRERKWDVLSKKSFPSKRLAQRELDRRLAPINSQDSRPSVVITFAYFVEKWKESVMIHHKPSSRDSERTLLKMHLIPAFGNTLLSDLRGQSVQQFINDWKLSPKTLRNAVTLLMGMWDTAKAWGYVEHTLFPRKENGKLMIRMPKQIKPKTYSFSLEETLAIIDRAQGKWKLVFRILALTGMRPGELAGMRRIDLDGRVIKLSQSVYRQQIQTPKTSNAVRGFTIPQELANDLSAYIEQTELEPNRHGLVFTNSVGGPMPMNKVLTKVLNPILEELGIRKKLEAMGISKAGHYAFRHMNITELRRMNVPLKTIQQRVGHALGSDVTDKHYVHAVDSDDMAAADMLGLLLMPKQGEQIQ